MCNSLPCIKQCLQNEDITLLSGIIILRPVQTHVQEQYNIHRRDIHTNVSLKRDPTTKCI